MITDDRLKADHAPLRSLDWYIAVLSTACRTRYLASDELIVSAFALCASGIARHKTVPSAWVEARSEVRLIDVVR